MWTFISVSLALVINFYTPEIPENNKLIKNNYAKNKRIKGFPYQYLRNSMLRNFLRHLMVCLIQRRQRLKNYSLKESRKKLKIRLSN